MKILKLTLLALLALAATAAAQTIELGQSVFYNDEGDIILTIDAALVDQKINSPYVMFMAYLVAKGNLSMSVNRKNVVMLYKDKEYQMPSLQEWLKKYKASQRDMDIYRSLGHETLEISQIRKYRFPWEQDFFPIKERSPLASSSLPNPPSAPSAPSPTTMVTLGDYFDNIRGRGSLPTDEGSLAETIGFRTKLYFENPGFKAGDQLVIMVHDTKNPELKGACTIILKGN